MLTEKETKRKMLALHRRVSALFERIVNGHIKIGGIACFALGLLAVQTGRSKKLSGEFDVIPCPVQKLHNQHKVCA